MHKRNLFSFGAACVLALLLLAAPLSAQAHHGGGRHGQTVSTVCQVCPVEGCTAVGRHTHNGVTYCGYAHAGGFCDGSCHALCPVEGCTVTGQHTHNGVTYCGYAHAGGFCDGSCHALCPVEGCTITGQHTHNGVTYCGYAHTGGFCDGSCRTAVAAATGGCHGGGGHHGRCG